MVCPILILTSTCFRAWSLDTSYGSFLHGRNDKNTISSLAPRLLSVVEKREPIIHTVYGVSSSLAWFPFSIRNQATVSLVTCMLLHCTKIQ